MMKTSPTPDAGVRRKLHVVYQTLFWDLAEHGRGEVIGRRGNVGSSKAYCCTKSFSEGSVKAAEGQFHAVSQPIEMEDSRVYEQIRPASRV